MSSTSIFQKPVVTIWIKENKESILDLNMVKKFKKIFNESKHVGKLYLLGQHYTDKEKNDVTSLGFIYIDVENLDLNLLENDKNEIKKILQNIEIYSKIHFTKILFILYFFEKNIDDQMMYSDIDILDVSDPKKKHQLFDILSDIDKDKKHQIYSITNTKFFVIKKNQQIIDHCRKNILSVAIPVLSKICDANLQHISPKYLIAIDNIIHKNYATHENIDYLYKIKKYFWLKMIFLDIVNKNDKIIKYFKNIIKTDDNIEVKKYIIKNNYIYLFDDLNLDMNILKFCIESYIIIADMFYDVYETFSDITKIHYYSLYEGTKFCKDNADKKYIDELTNLLKINQLL